MLEDSEIPQGDRLPSPQREGGDYTDRPDSVRCQVLKMFLRSVSVKRRGRGARLTSRRLSVH